MDEKLLYPPAKRRRSEYPITLTGQQFTPTETFSFRETHKLPSYIRETLHKPSIPHSLPYYEPSRSELKYCDLIPISAGSGISVSAPGAACLNLIAQGVASNQRIGRIITMKSVQIRGRIQINFYQPSEVLASFVCLYILYDRQPNGALPAPTDVLTGDASTFFNLSNSDRFVTVYKKTMVLPPPAFADAGNNIFLIDVYRRINLPTVYKDSTSAITGISTGSLLVYCLGTVGVADNSRPLIYITSRVRFQDE